MGVRERLSLEAVGAEPLIASEHVHRYGLAARLCDGLRVVDLACGSGYGAAILRETATAVLGVDRDAAVVDMARVTIGSQRDVRFEAADAGDFLARGLAADHDAIVCFEGLEHFSDREAILDTLAGHAASGMRLVMSLPNQDERGYEDAVAAFERFDQVTVLYQFLAEGSLIRADEPAELAGEFVLQEHGELEWAGYFIACVNLEERVRELADSGQMQLTVAPHYNRRIRELERANRELWRENARIARERIGMGGSAAAMASERARHLELRARHLDARVRELESVLAAPRHQWIERIRDWIRGRTALDRAARRVGELMHRE